MCERETRDFMSVDAFSQLPFIRSVPPSGGGKSPSGGSTAASGIRLFGIEFSNEPDVVEDEASTKDTASNDGGGSGGGTAAAAETTRKFECHYCCRNFPTSQALGGHQNAHKRERQHAKRAYLQSAMAAQHHQAHGYGIVNYHHLTSIPATNRFGFESSPSWNGAGAGAGLGGARFYVGAGSVSQPINGSPLPGMWRIPPVQGGRGFISPQSGLSTVLPSLGAEDLRAAGGGRMEIGGAAAAPRSASSVASPQGRFAYESAAAGVKEHLSLDLRL